MNGGVDLYAVGCPSGNDSGIVCFKVIGMNEVNIRFAAHALEDPIVFGYFKRVPAHVGDLKSAVPVRDFSDTSLEQSKAFYAGTFLTAVEEQLKTETDTEQGFTGGDKILNGVSSAGLIHTIHSVSEGADAGEDSSVCGEELRFIIGNTAIAADKVKSLNDALEVTGAVINNSDHNIIPFSEDIMMITQTGGIIKTCMKMHAATALRS